MPEPLILDTNILKHIARGHQSAADALKRYLGSGTQVYISRAAYEELVTQAKTPQLGGQYRELLKDLHIQIAPSGAMADRGNFYADNIQHEPGRGEPGQIKEYGHKNTKPGDVFVAAQAKAIGAKLWTMDGDLAKRAAHQGVRMAPESAMQGISGPEDVHAARARLGLKDPKRFDSKGNVLPATVRGAKSSARPAGSAGGKPAGSPTGRLTGSTGVADKAMPIDVGPSPRGEAIFGGLELLFQGVNFGLNLLNDRIQKRNVDDALKKIERSVAQARSARPEEGVLLVFNYTQTEAPSESLIRPGAVFQYVIWGQGATRDEALRDALKAGSISAGGANQKRSSQEVWLPPLQKPLLTNAKIPFAVVATGRFHLGSSNQARFQMVEFSTFGGFDDIAERKIDLPNARNAQFSILQPPENVNFFAQGSPGRQRVPRKRCLTANGQEILAVDLDPYNPFDVCAVMCFPIDNWCEEVFKTVRATDGHGVLHYLNFSMIRWIRPGNIEVV